jgi:hypothetical protein
MMIWRLLASVLAGVFASGERTSSGCLGLSESGISGSRRLIRSLHNVGDHLGQTHPVSDHSRQRHLMLQRMLESAGSQMLPRAW